MSTTTVTNTEAKVDQVETMSQTDVVVEYNGFIIVGFDGKLVMCEDKTYRYVNKLDGHAPKLFSSMKELVNSDFYQVGAAVKAIKVKLCNHAE